MDWECICIALASNGLHWLTSAWPNKIVHVQIKLKNSLSFRENFNTKREKSMGGNLSKEVITIIALSTCDYWPFAFRSKQNFKHSLETTKLDIANGRNSINLRVKRALNRSNRVDRGCLSTIIPQIGLSLDIFQVGKWMVFIQLDFRSIVVECRIVDAFPKFEWSTNCFGAKFKFPTLRSLQIKQQIFQCIVY